MGKGVEVGVKLPKTKGSLEEAKGIKISGSTV